MCGIFSLVDRLFLQCRIEEVQIRMCRSDGECVVGSMFWWCLNVCKFVDVDCASGGMNLLQLSWQSVWLLTIRSPVRTRLGELFAFFTHHNALLFIKRIHFTHYYPLYVQFYSNKPTQLIQTLRSSDIPSLLHTHTTLHDKYNLFFHSTSTSSTYLLIYSSP